MSASDGSEATAIRAAAAAAADGHTAACAHHEEHGHAETKGDSSGVAAAAATAAGGEEPTGAVEGAEEDEDGLLPAVSGLSVDDIINGNLEKTLAYLKACMLKGVPDGYTPLDSSRSVLLYFCVISLDICGAIEKVPRQAIIDWIYSLQILPTSPADCGEVDPELLTRIGSAEDSLHCGFAAGTLSGRPFNPSPTKFCRMSDCDSAYLPSTYVAICLLVTLGDDLSRVNKKALLNALKPLQLSDGSCGYMGWGSEADLRYVFCVCALCHMLGDWSVIDKEAAMQYIFRCQTYDGSFALTPDGEGQGGATFTGMAALSLLGGMDRLPHRDRLLEWCAMRQVGGFQGRRNKDPDSCYSFWVGGTMHLLGMGHLIEPEPLWKFLSQCATPYGGFSKLPRAYPDLMHTTYSLFGLCLTQYPGVQPLDVVLGISQRAAASLASIRKE